MKLLFDTNVWIASLVARGLCADLVRLALVNHGDGRLEMLICPAVRQEVFRLLQNKFNATRQQQMNVDAVFQLLQDVPDGQWRPPPDFPDADDVPIVGAALAAGADLLVTGDRALLVLTRIERLSIVPPRAAYLQLRGLG